MSDAAPRQRNRRAERLRRRLRRLTNRVREAERGDYRRRGIRGTIPHEGEGEIDPEDVVRAIEEAAEFGGDPNEFYQFVIRMGAAGSVYRPTLATRLNACAQLEPIVEPASESAADMAIAKAVEKHVLPFAREVAPRLLMAVGHGVSVVEVQWDTTMMPWRPVEHRWHRPRLLRAPLEDDPRVWMVGDYGESRDGDLREPVMTGDGRWLDHRGGMAGPTPFIAGVAAPCIYWWLAKLRARVRWSAFLDTYGFPLRVGYYDDTTSDDEASKLQEALKNMGRDVGALLPGVHGDDGTWHGPVEVINGAATTGGTSDYFGNFVSQCDRQIEIAVLGQTASTEGTPGRLGGDDAQENVRRDIALADAAALGRTQTDQIAAPFVRYNHGETAPVPEIRWPVPDPPDNLEAWGKTTVAFIDKGGLQVRAEDVRERLHLAAPEGDDEVLGGAVAVDEDEPMPGGDEPPEDAE